MSAHLLFSLLGYDDLRGSLQVYWNSVNLALRFWYWASDNNFLISIPYEAVRKRAVLAFSRISGPFLAGLPCLNRPRI